MMLAGMQGGEAPPAAAHVPTKEYFDEYALLYDHIGMLRDFKRMSAYHDAIKQNAAADFEGKVVLDVGTGTGVLAIWAAQAGARKVYAVEATGCARHAEALAKANGVGGVVEVVRGTLEDVTLPEQVDVIVSEWMGYFLLRESMVESVLLARDRWLRPGGKMYPATARLMLAPIEDEPFVAKRREEVVDVMRQWDELDDKMRASYGISLEALRPAYVSEHDDWLYRSGWQVGPALRLALLSRARPASHPPPPPPHTHTHTHARAEPLPSSHR